MTGSDDELEKLRQQTDVGNRLQNASDADDTETLEDKIVTLLDLMDDGKTSKTLSVRDKRMAALVFALEETDELDDLGVALQKALGREPDSDAVDRSEVLRLAIRVGLNEAAPDTLEVARNAYVRHASDQF